MEDGLVFEDFEGENRISRRTAPEFYRLYGRAVLLALREQGILSEEQAERCLEVWDGRD